MFIVKDAMTSVKKNSRAKPKAKKKSNRTVRRRKVREPPPLAKWDTDCALNVAVFPADQEVCYEFENWEKTPLDKLYDCDREKHFSNEWIDAWIDTVHKFDQKRTEMLVANPEQKPEGLTIEWGDNDYVYPTRDCSPCNGRRRFRKFMLSHNLKIDYKKRVLILVEENVTDDRRIHVFKGRIILRPQYLDALWTNEHYNCGHLPKTTTRQNINDGYFLWKCQPWILARAKLCGCNKEEDNAVVQLAAGRSGCNISPLPPEPVSVIHIDLSVGYPESFSGNNYMLHIVDQYSRYLVLCPIPDKEAQTICYYLKRDFFRYFGFPSNIYSDNGTEFKNIDMKAILAFLNIKGINTRPYRPQGDSYAELSVKKWKKWFKRVVLNSTSRYREIDLARTSDWPRDWDQYSDRAQLAINSIVNPATKLKPMNFFLNKGNHLLEYLLEHGDPFKKKSLSLDDKSERDCVDVNIESITLADAEVKSQPDASDFYDQFEFNQDLISQPNPRESEYGYSRANCFGRNANDISNDKMSILYRDCARLNKHKVAESNAWAAKCIYKHQYDKEILEFPIGTKVRYFQGKKLTPRFFFPFVWCVLLFFNGNTVRDVWWYLITLPKVVVFLLISTIRESRPFRPIK